MQANKNNKVFCYEDILATFVFDSEKNTYLLFDQNHPKGIALPQLPDKREWYVCGNDNIHRVPYKYEANYQSSLHIVAIRFKFDRTVENIECKKYNINFQLNKLGKPIMFNPSWENYMRREVMQTPCTTDNMLSRFALIMYHVVFEETMVGGVRRFNLGEFKSHYFTEVVNALRNHYSHGRSEFVQGKSLRIEDIYIRYLKSNEGPRTLDDYSVIQFGVLKDFSNFLDEILEDIKSDITYIDIIQEDLYGNIYCGKVLLPGYYSTFKGYRCCIKSTKENTNENNKEAYPYFCDKPEYIETKIVGEISIDSTGTCFCNDCKLPLSLSDELGRVIEITKIRPIKSELYNQEAVSYRIKSRKESATIKNESSIWPFSVSLSKKLKLDKFTLSNKDQEKPSVALDIPSVVKIDEEGRTYIGNILVGKKKGCKAGDIIVMKKIGKNPAPIDELIAKYPFVAETIERKNSDENTDKELPTVGPDTECVVEVDKYNKMHVGNIFIPSHYKCEEGNIIKIVTIRKNTIANPFAKKTYPFVALQIEVL